MNLNCSGRLATSLFLVLAGVGACTPPGSEKPTPEKQDRAALSADAQNAPAPGDKREPSKPSGASDRNAKADPARDTKADRGDSPAPSGGGDTVSPSDLDFVEAKMTVDKAEGDPQKDAWNYFNLWGELKNKSSKWVVEIHGDIRYFDASGKELGIDSIGTAVKEDIGDKSPGEPVRGETMFVAPGASIPMHHIRSLNKIGGTVASYKIALRPARVAASHPDVAIEGMSDQVANVANESLQNANPQDHRVVGGTLKNNGNLACRDPGLIVGFYDASGKLADLKEGDARPEVKELAPGASATVKAFTLVGFDDAWKAKATIKTWVRCSEPY